MLDRNLYKKVAGKWYKLEAVYSFQKVWCRAIRYRMNGKIVEEIYYGDQIIENLMEAK